MSHLAKSICFLLSAALLFGPLTASAAKIYLSSSGNATADAVMKLALESRGHSVQIGAEWFQLDGTQPIASYDVVILAASYNWSNPAIPLAGQQALSDFVEAGGGLIVTAWLTYNAFGEASYAVFNETQPVESPDSEFRTQTAVAYSQSSPDPILNYLVPPVFEFPATNIAGTESYLVPRPGATAYYATGGTFDDYVPGRTGQGLVGWSFGAGRVAVFSVLAGIGSFTGSPTFAQLFSNAAYWAHAPRAAAPSLAISGKKVQRIRGRSAKIRGTFTSGLPVPEVTFRASGIRGRKTAQLASGSWTATVRPIKRKRTTVRIFATDVAGRGATATARIVKR